VSTTPRIPAELVAGYPGKEASSRQFFPTEDVYGESPELLEAIAELEERGIAVRPEDAPAAAR
jgi:hypothetical protein